MVARAMAIQGALVHRGAPRGVPQPPALLIERFSVREEAPRAYMPKAPEPRVGKKLTGSLGVCPVLEGMREGR